MKSKDFLKRENVLNAFIGVSTPNMLVVSDMAGLTALYFAYCYECNLNFSPVSSDLYGCMECHDDCLRAGVNTSLGYCYGQSASECSSYSLDGISGPDCSNWDLICKNGTAETDCSDRNCAVEYFDTVCESQYLPCLGTPGQNEELYIDVDFDIGDSGIIEYYISTGNIHEVFDISNDGALFVKTSLDFEEMNSYTLTILAYNPGNLFEYRYSDISVDIIIEDINDFIPEFSLTNYTFIFASNFQSEISYNDGIYTATALVTIFVEEPNLYSPLFSNSNGSFNILENNYSTDVLLITATDNDIGANAVISYTITDNYYIPIDQSSGVLTLVNLFHYEQIQILSLVITAEDNASPWQRKSTTLPVEIVVLDENDSPAIFAESTYIFTVVNNTIVAGIIGRIIATDVDTSSTLLYQFTTTSDYFDIDPFTGDIFVAKELVIQSPTITVSVNDSIHTDSAIVIINVIPANLHTPIFPQHNFTISIPEGTSIGNSILQTNAVNMDTGINGDITYSISYNIYCIVNSTTGIIVLTPLLDAETDPVEISFDLSATDNAYSSFRKSSFVTVIIQIENVND
ncbi:Cadherin EGF LAG seven-pass G-type receptor 2-like isoform X2 [Oopsacas minuta]|uniref:Cadherin EGF LAG seven-pass G-type receptor 2-like isoform X2 n=1 Tax=Oopsacas minuta TaxID=111878 RepID=A0AAV7K3L8_9METZ|nr:Cadherin EGF LAG seven-pass G-type receptor 2-like isoform X2 [Oopsacas minuta]